MAIPIKEPGDRIAAAEWNELAADYNNSYRKSPTDAPAVPPPLYGLYTAAAPVYSVFGMYGPATQKDDETPIVKIAPIGSSTGSLGYPFGLCTNGPYPAEANKECPIEIITNGKPIKIDVAATDTGFAVGRPCGPKLNSLQAASSGVGFVCLTTPQTYQTDRKFIWAFAQDAPILIAKTTATIASGETTPEDATVDVQVEEAASLVTDHQMSVKHIGPAINDAAGKLVFLLPIFGLGYTIINPVGGIQDIRIEASTKKFQYTKDNSTWTDWHTGTDTCPPPASP